MKPRRGSLGKANWPTWLQHPEMKGVFIGGCVSRGIGSSFRAKAHAHFGDEHRGWICFRSTKWLDNKFLCLHELAHIVTRQGHTDRWRKFLLQIGGTLDPVPGVLRSYQKQPRTLLPPLIPAHLPFPRVPESGEGETTARLLQGEQL